MIEADYNKIILQRIEKHYNRLLPYCGAVAILSAVAIVNSHLPFYFVIADSIIGIVFFVLAVLKDRLSMSVKINTTISVAILIGVLSFLDGGFSSAGITLIMIANTVSVLFLEKKYSITTSLVSVLIFLGLWIYASVFPLDVSVETENVKWLIQFIVFCLFIVILHTLVYSIKDYLLETIVHLEDKVNKIYELAYTDKLTGLPNQEQLKKVYLSDLRDGTKGFFLMINLFNLSLINSLYGEAVGDDLLKKVAKDYSNLLVRGEFLARISGNEFCLWIEGDDQDYLMERVHNFGDEYFSSFELRGLHKKVKYKLGCAYHDSIYSVEDSFQKAKIALTYLKSNKDQDFILFDDELEEMILSEEWLVERIETAIKDKGFHLAYQGKFDLNKEVITSVEALARLRDVALGEVSPAIFIPLIEKKSLSIEFGEMIIDMVLSDYSQLTKVYTNEISVAINISPTHLMHTGFVDYITEKTYTYNIPPNKIILEITEELMLNNLKQANYMLRILQSLGYKISLDDFGTGYSSLSYLSALNINEIKIDKIFISQMMADKKVALMTQMIVDLSNSYDLTIVAEGVETEEQLKIVSKMGVDQIQGFLISHPKPLN